MKPAPLWQRVLQRTEITPGPLDTPCWVFTGSTRRGYGRIGSGGQMVALHRLSYETYVGAIPAGLQTDHLCRNRACWCPEHLEPVTHIENMRRARPDVCIRGHEFTPENTYFRRNAPGRRCRTCDSLRNREIYLRLMAARRAS